MKNKILILLIVLLGGFMRLQNLNNSPPSLNWDEASLGYNAYSILKTGKDEYGKIFPLFTRSFDDYKSTLSVYSIIPFIKLMGLNAWAVRIPAALSGTLIILVVYLLIVEITKRKDWAILASLAIAAEPWAIHLSRVYHESTEGLLLLLLGLLYWEKAKKKSYYVYLGTLFLGLAMFIYHSYKVVVPLFVLVYLAFNWIEIKNLSVEIKRNVMVLGGVIGAVFAVYIFKGQVFPRAGSTAIFSIWKIGETDFYNIVWDLTGRYLAYFSPMNLFVREPLEPSTILAGNSIFYPFEFLFWVIGFYVVVQEFKKYKNLILLLLVSPMAAILTWNWFQPGRVLPLWAVFSIFIGIGIAEIVGQYKNWFWKLGVMSIVLIFYGFNLVYVYDAINVQLPWRDSGNWQPGFRESVPLIMEQSMEYDRVIVESSQAQPYIFYLFYGAYDPEKYLSEIDLEKIGTPRKSFDFGKFEFRKIYWPEDRNMKSTLFVGGVFSLPEQDLGEVDYWEDVLNRDEWVMARIVGNK